MKFLESFVIRFLWVKHDLFHSYIDLCPPSCMESHTYKWPCRKRIRRQKDKDYARYEYYDKERFGGDEDEKIVICGNTRAAAYGAPTMICALPKNHEDDDIPHIWMEK